MKGTNRILWAFAFLLPIITLLFLKVYDQKIKELKLKEDKSAPVHATHPKPAKYKPKAIPAGEDAYTWKKYREAEEALDVKKGVEYYEKYGSKSSLWDRQVKSLLVDLAREKFNTKSSKTISRGFLDRIEAVVELGCDDPYIIYLHAKLLKSVQGNKKAEPVAERALNLLEKSQYPPMYKFFAARRLQWIYQGNPSKKEMLSEIRCKKMTYLAQAAAQKCFANGNQRFYMVDVLREWNHGVHMPEKVDVLLAELEKTADVDPWIHLMVKGLYHNTKGWNARGGGYADTVTQEGWEIFREELAIATGFFVEAHEMHPEFPEAATEMISIAVASCGENKERMWFDRAVAAQMDYGYAYRKYLWGLWPRWGGSHKQMYRFGLECLNTGRFDTDVPEYFRLVLKEIGTEVDDWRTPLRGPGVYENLKKYYLGMYSEPTRKDKQVFWKSSLGMTAWVTGNYADAQEIFDELGDKLDDCAFTNYDTDKTIALAETRLMTGAHREVFSKAEGFFNNNQFQEARPLYEDLRAKMKGDRDLFIINDRLVILEIKNIYIKGEWVDLNPDQSMAGWLSQRGKWSVEKKDGSLKGETTGKENSIMCLNGFNINGNYEIRGQVEAEYMSGINLGCYNKNFLTVHIDRYRKRLGLGRQFYAAKKVVPIEQLPAKIDFNITVKDGSVTVSLNGKTYFENEPIRSHWWNPRVGKIGVGQYFGKSKGHVIKYRNLQIRKLPAENS